MQWQSAIYHVSLDLPGSLVQPNCKKTVKVEQNSFVSRIAVNYTARRIGWRASVSATSLKCVSQARVLFKWRMYECADVRAKSVP